MESLPHKPAIALCTPEIAENTGTLLRLGACLDVPIHLIRPLGFAFSERRLRRAGMDYIDQVKLFDHADWSEFLNYAQTQGHRLIATCPQAPNLHTQFTFSAQDILVLGPESVGLNNDQQAACPHKVAIPTAENTRSLNVAIAGALILGEALRQLNAFPGDSPSTAP